MKDYSKYIFLLGGYDLEMLETRKILEQLHIAFFDNDFEWGAKLSSYANRFDKEHVFVGVELLSDCKLPENYIDFDRHNEKSKFPSLIEQVAELLRIELNHWQHLVAAIDKGYIPTLQVAGATKGELLKIRKVDRAAQGVTEGDERLTKLSLWENLTTEQGITIVKSLTSKFLTIIDRLSFK